MGTYPFAKSRLQLVRQLRDVLTAEWNAELAVFVVTELELSARKYQKLRLALCTRRMMSSGGSGRGTVALSPIRWCGCLSPSCLTMFGRSA